MVAVFDAEAGGTWMGMEASTGRFAALTNVRCKAGPGKGDAVSRGALVTDALAHRLGLDSLALSSDPCSLVLPGPMAGFNLVVAPAGEAAMPAYVTNRSVVQSEGGPTLARAVDAIGPSGDEAPFCTAEARALAGEVHCVSNSGMDDVSWPKVRWLKARAESAVAAARAEAGSEGGAQAAAPAGDGLPELSSLLRRLLPLFLASSVSGPGWEASVGTEGIGWSPAPRDVELRLQRGPFAPGEPGYPAVLTTRTVTVAAHTDTHAYFASRDLEALQRAAAGEEAAWEGLGTGDVGAAEVVSDELQALLGADWPPEAGIGIEEAAGQGRAPVAEFGVEAAAAAAADEGLRELLLECWRAPMRAVRVPLPR